jgi:MerR HTH family regulatory protein
MRPNTVRAEVDRKWASSCPRASPVLTIKVSSCPGPTIATMSDTPYSIGDAAAAVGRSTNTIRRWEQLGYIPQARRVSGRRRYSEDDLALLRRRVEHPPSEAPRPEVVRPWTETAELDTVRPWAEMTGKTTTARFGDLPAKCGECWRSLVRHGITDPHGRRWLQASCEVHGLQGRRLWT